MNLLYPRHLGAPIAASLLLLAASGCEQNNPRETDQISRSAPEQEENDAKSPDSIVEQVIDKGEASHDPNSPTSAQNERGAGEGADDEKLAASNGSLGQLKKTPSEAILGDGISTDLDALGALEGTSIGEASGSGGLGLRGVGRGGGGRGGGGIAQGYGRIGGLGKIDTGGGKGARGITNPRRRRRLAVRDGEARVQGALDKNNTRGEDSGVEATDSTDSTPVKRNPWTQTAADKQSTFALDVDTGSYTLARRTINSGRLPSASTVRIEEFVNYFDYAYPQPAGKFGVYMEASPSPFTGDKNIKMLRVGLQAKRIDPAKRKPVHLTFLVDTSGSMSGSDRIGLVKKSLRLLTKKLRKDDTVAMATYSGSTTIVLEHTAAKERATILRAINKLNTGGGTAMASGMELAYKLALKGQQGKGEHEHRVIVLSDGDANIGGRSRRGISKTIRKYVEDGVTMSTIGFGMGNYRDGMMEQLANHGNGNYHYIDSMKEARKVFGSQLDGTLEVLAKDVKLQVEFDPEVIKRYRLIGYENRDIADKDFRNDRVDAGEVGSGHSVTALYEVELFEQVDVPNLATVRLRYKEPRGSRAKETAFAFTADRLHPRLQDASEGFVFAAAVSAFAEILRTGGGEHGLNLALVEELAKLASKKGQSDRQEFIGLVQKARKLQARN